MNNVIPVILSGGSGTRLWPLSRTTCPKQFIRFLDGQETTFLAATLQRMASANGFGAPLILANDAHRFLVRDELAEIGATCREIILEPVARNTAPAVAIAAMRALEFDPQAVIVVVPSRSCH